MSSKNVVQYRQRRKKWAVDAFGGKCGICGYHKCMEALEFHHIDPSQKDFSPSAASVNKELFVEELRKCVCLCSNCHREVHAGVVNLSESIQKFDENQLKNLLPEKPKHPCKECGKMTNINQTFCSVKCSRKSREVTEWPDNATLKQLVSMNGYTKTGKMFGVSDNAVRKRLKNEH